MKEKMIGIVSILLIVGISVAISGCTSNSNSTSDTKVFENQYVKFTYPANWVVVDQTNGSSIEILLFSDTPEKQDSTDPKYLGAIENGDNPILYLQTVNEQKTIGTINGKSVAVFVDEALGTYNAVFTLSNQRVYGGLYFTLDIMQPDSVFESIKNSIIIKQVPQTNSTSTSSKKTSQSTKTNTSSSKSTTTGSITSNKTSNKSSGSGYG
jgi:hypothetical protein